MAKREWFPRQRDALQRHRNLITYLLVVLGLAVIVMFKGLTRREAEQMEDAPEPEDEPADPERRNGPPSATAP